jgi:hypothetical protein
MWETGARVGEFGPLDAIATLASPQRCIEQFQDRKRGFHPLRRLCRKFFVLLAIARDFGFSSSSQRYRRFAGDVVQATWVAPSKVSRLMDFELYEFKWSVMGGMEDLQSAGNGGIDDSGSCTAQAKTNARTVDNNPSIKRSDSVSRLLMLPLELRRRIFEAVFEVPSTVAFPSQRANSPKRLLGLIVCLAIASNQSQHESNRG